MGSRSDGRTKRAALAALFHAVFSGLMAARGEDAVAAPAEPLSYLRNTHIFAFQKDEVELLADWVAYHARLVGPQNLHIIDHNSSLPAVVETLRSMRSAGIHIVDFSGPFNTAQGKGPQMTKLMLQVRNDNADAEFLVPLDVDEFLVATTSDSSVPLTDAASIQDAFAKLPRDQHKIKLGFFEAMNCDLDNADVISGLRAPIRRAVEARYFRNGPAGYDCHVKTVFPTRGFLNTDQGNHKGDVEADKLCSERQDLMQCTFSHSEHCFHVRKQLAFVHYNNAAMSWPTYLGKMVRGAGAYGYSGKATRPGEHPCLDAQSGTHYCAFMARLAEEGEGLLRKEFAVMQLKQCAAASLQTAVADEVLRTTPFWR